MWERNRLSDNVPASKYTLRSGLVASSMTRWNAVHSGNSADVSRTIALVGTFDDDTTATDLPAIVLSRLAGFVPVSRSNTMYASASPTPILFASSPPSSAAPLSPSAPSRRTFRFDSTGPPFWARPVWSRPLAVLPSSRAAVASIWLTVTTPVPPMPIIRMLPSSMRSGSGRSSPIVSTAAVALVGTLPPGTTSMNAGQSPSRQVKSLLHDDW